MIEPTGLILLAAVVLTAARDLRSRARPQPTSRQVARVGNAVAACRDTGPRHVLTCTDIILDFRPCTDSVRVTVD